MNPYENDTLKIRSVSSGSYMVMATQTQGEVVKDSVQQFFLRALYQLENTQFVIPQPPITGEMKMVSGDKDQNPLDLLEVQVITPNESQIIQLRGGALQIQAPVIFSQEGLNFRLSYGSKQFMVPFSVKLRDFQLDRYPGSMSPKSYASEITVITASWAPSRAL